MQILGIDPGTTHSGIVLYSSHIKRVVMSDKAMPNEDVMRLLYGQTSWGAYQGFNEIVIEALSPRGQVVGWSTFGTIMWVGRMFEAAHAARMLLGRTHLLGVELIHRDEIKRRLLGRTNLPGADKHIRQLLVDQVGAKGVKAKPGPTFGVSSHAWQALAAVWAHLHPEGVS